MTKGGELFEAGEHVNYIHRGSSRSRTFEIPAIVLEVHPKSYLIQIEGAREKRYIDKKLNKLKKLPVIGQ